MTNMKVNYLVEVNYSTAVYIPKENVVKKTVFEACGSKLIPYRHQENHFVDFDHEPLLPHKISQEGPGITVGDVNQDGLEDISSAVHCSSREKFFYRERTEHLQART